MSKDFNIVSIDTQNNSIIINWGWVTLNHSIPLYILENLELSQQEILEHLEYMRPVQPPQYEIPTTLLDMAPAVEGVSEADTGSGVPFSVSRAQGKAALVQAGLWEAVKSYADSIEDPTQAALADIALNDTATWERSSPFLVAAAQSLGMSGEDIDNLFIQASEVRL